MISSLNPQQISEVKIFRSGASAQYGNRISGVIDLRSDRRIPEKVGGSLGANLTHMDALLKFPIMKDKVGVSVSFRRSYNDFINTPTFNEYSNFVFQNTSLSKDKASEFNYLNADLNFYFQDLALNTTFNFSDNHKLTLNYLYSLNDLDFSFFLDDSFKWKNRLRVNNKGFSVVSEGWWNQHIRHSIKAEFSNYEFDYYFQGLIDSDDRNKELRQNAIENLGLGADVQIRLNSFSKLRAGLQVAIQKVDYKLQGRFNGLDNYVDIKIKGKEDSFALYSELQLKYPKSIYVNLGLRLNYLTSKGKNVFVITNGTNVSQFKNIKDSYYWSVTEYDSSGSWIVYFDNGFDGWSFQTSSLYAVCVRDL